MSGRQVMCLVRCHYHQDDDRTGARFAVPEHLRPKPRRSGDGDCALYQRLAQPAPRALWRRYDVVDYLPAAEAQAVPVAGEA